MKKYDTIVIGAGASGLIASSRLKGNTLLIECNDRVGKKILATGNGKCNLTNKNLSGEYYSNPQFFDSVFENNKGIVKEYFHSLGMLTKLDKSGRVYPYTQQASTVLDILRNSVTCETKLSQKALSVEKNDNGYRVITDKGEYLSTYVIVATGGGKGLLSKLVDITDTYPSLCPLKTDTNHIKGLDGVRVQCGVSLLNDDKKVYFENGEVLFRNYGVSGVAVFNVSAYVARDKVKGNKGNWTISLDFLVDTDKEEVRRIVKTRIENGDDKQKLLLGIVCNKLSDCILRRVDRIDVDSIIKLLTDYQITVKDLYGESAQVTSGGVNLDCVTFDFEAKAHRGLFVTGEALDIDGLCGGYNLHWAFMSGLIVAKYISNKL